ncbi:hypothetical protein EHS25_007165 [Saitozyma podzolica]|uniref:Ricin B lectin domain-containing protein n=1 Tax=Saitozyma podzolica TaxID=1890683 RepID=A0A427XPC3_9TREE|nr:hypothetical protein EHS25_007165 [Saitozyma podzolica]
MPHLMWTTGLLAVLALVSAVPRLQDVVPRGLAPGFDSNAVTLSPANQPNMCLGTADPPGNDVELYLIPCDTTESFWGAWDIQPGNNPSVRLSGTNFCLDAGALPMNNGPAKLYTCYPGLSQQQWYYTPDLHVAVTGGNQCLDYEVICGLGGCAPGTRDCGSSDAQSWTSKPADENISEYTSPETSSIDRNIDIAGGVLIHPNGDTTKCLTPSGSSYGDGVPLIFRGAGEVRTTGANFCLDSTTQFPPDGQGLKLWTWWGSLDLQLGLMPARRSHFLPPSATPACPSRIGTILRTITLRLQEAPAVPTSGKKTAPPSKSGAVPAPTHSRCSSPAPKAELSDRQLLSCVHGWNGHTDFFEPATWNPDLVKRTLYIALCENM